MRLSDYQFFRLIPPARLFHSALPFRCELKRKSGLLFNSFYFLFIMKMLRLNHLKTRTAVNANISVFLICVEAIIYLLLYNLHDCTFKSFLNLHGMFLQKNNILVGKTPLIDYQCLCYCFAVLWNNFGLLGKRCYFIHCQGNFFTIFCQICQVLIFGHCYVKVCSVPFLFVALLQFIFTECGQYISLFLE